MESHWPHACQRKVLNSKLHFFFFPFGSSHISFRSCKLSFLCLDNLFPVLSPKKILLVSLSRAHPTGSIITPSPHLSFLSSVSEHWIIPMCVDIGSPLMDQTCSWPLRDPGRPPDFGWYEECLHAVSPFYLPDAFRPQFLQPSSQPQTEDTSYLAKTQGCTEWLTDKPFTLTWLPCLRGLSPPLNSPVWTLCTEWPLALTGCEREKLETAPGGSFHLYLPLLLSSSLDPQFLWFLADSPAPPELCSLHSPICSLTHCG